jgi:UDP-glucose 4-epimerase
VKLLVTGATGFLGSALIGRACTDHDVVAVARLPPANADAAGPVWVQADLASRQLTRRLPSDIDAVIHLAQSRYSRDFPEHALDIVEVNVSATAALIDHAVRHGAKRFVFASTATVYRPSHRPIREDAPLDCSDGYAASKRAAEMLIGAYQGLISCWVLRVFTPYGAGQRPDRLIPSLVDRVRQGEPLAIDGRRGLLLSPIHVADVVEAMMAAATSDTEEVCTLNVGGAEALGISEIATVIGELAGRSPLLRFTDRPEPGGYVADRAAFSRRYPSLPRPRSFRDGIATLVKSEASV